MKQTITTYPNKELFTATRDIPKDQLAPEEKIFLRKKVLIIIGIEFSD